MSKKEWLEKAYLLLGRMDFVLSDIQKKAVEIFLRSAEDEPNVFDD